MLKKYGDEGFVYTDEEPTGIEIFLSWETIASLIEGNNFDEVLGIEVQGDGVSFFVEPKGRFKGH